MDDINSIYYYFRNLIMNAIFSFSNLVIQILSMSLQSRFLIHSNICLVNYTIERSSCVSYLLVLVYNRHNRDLVDPVSGYHLVVEVVREAGLLEVVQLAVFQLVVVAIQEIRREIHQGHCQELLLLYQVVGDRLRHQNREMTHPMVHLEAHQNKYLDTCN